MPYRYIIHSSYVYLLENIKIIIFIKHFNKTNTILGRYLHILIQTFVFTTSTIVYKGIFCRRSIQLLVLCECKIMLIEIFYVGTYYMFSMYMCLADSF